ncbi:MAG: fluoride efflux transporter CrcB [Bacteroidetes bacterium]|nr:fluoride efflux transporter CrcB [Bacteroidota bacterium]MBS1941920.1 fluoride efflux transporter CrcB [Bacteroidota bacterium]
MNRLWLIVGLGGFLGSVARYLASTQLTRLFPATFPWGTFAVNVIGSLIIGLVFGFSQRYNWASPEWRLFLATGFCGGFTTFSTFAYENLQLIQSGNYGLFALYATASVVLCIAGAALGYFLSTLQ